MPEIAKNWDAIVIGGGVAGCAAAIWLAREQKRVLLIEKEQAAHHKVCGEFISTEAEHYLKTLGLDLPALGAEQIEHVCLIHGKGEAKARLPFHASSLSRFVLDEALLNLAIAAGVHVQRGTAVTDLSRDGSRWQVQCADGKMDGADAIFLATGKHNLKHWPRGAGAQNDLIGFKMHFRLTAAQTAALSGHVEITLFKGGYAGLEPIENGVANLCLVVKKTRYQDCGKSWFQLLDYLCQSSPPLADRLGAATALWDRPLAIFGIPYGYVYDSRSGDEAGLYRLGDQMAVIPSFSGDGMAIALHTAKLAVSAYLDEDSKSYYVRARQELLPLIKRATSLSQLAAMSIIQRLIVGACRLSPKLLELIARKTRIKMKPSVSKI